MGKLYLEVVTPEKVMVSREVEIVAAPGSGKTEFLAVTTGFAEISDNKVSVLVDAAEKAGEIDVERARQALERARERLSKQAEDIDFARAEMALKRAIARIKTAEKTS